MFTLKEYSGGYYILTVQFKGFVFERALMDADIPLEEIKKSERAADGLSMEIPIGEK